MFPCFRNGPIIADFGGLCRMAQCRCATGGRGPSFLGVNKPPPLQMQRGKRRLDESTYAKAAAKAPRSQDEHGAPVKAKPQKRNAAELGKSGQALRYQLRFRAREGRGPSCVRVNKQRPYEGKKPTLRERRSGWGTRKAKRQGLGHPHGRQMPQNSGKAASSRRTPRHLPQNLAKAAKLCATLLRRAGANLAHG
jgi:hypothetical protein